MQSVIFFPRKRFSVIYSWGSIIHKYWNEFQWLIYAFRVCLSLSQARSSERNRVTRSTPTYFRQTYGLLRNRDVRTVCSCQSSDFSTKSRHRQRDRARRSERTTRHSGAAPSISLSLRGRRSASLTLIHSRSYVHTCAFARAFICAEYART